MYKRIFLDANILLDIFSSDRPSHGYSLQSYRYILNQSDIQLFTSCDIVTTLYYVGAKLDKHLILDRIEGINKILKVIEFSNKEVSQTCSLMKEDKKYKDLEDTIQYILAKKENCDLIISNDENFYAKDIEVMSSKEFCKKVGV
jgi:predicted nucleic acid-binding protein